MNSKLHRIIIKLTNLISNIFEKSKIVLIHEDANWVIKDYVNEIKNNLKGSIKTSIIFNGLRNKIIHLSSFNLIFYKNKINLPNNSNKIILTCFHLNQNDERIKFIKLLDKKIYLWHTSCTITKSKLIKFGASKDKIIIIPLGINLGKFYKIHSESNFIRKKYCLDNDTIIIGSFQKDGVGWNKGNKPKSEKGPELLCDLLIKISKHFKIFILLSGPSRGYVKKRLSENNIPFHHQFFKNSKSLNSFYNLIDFYFITSKIEGGPMQLLESFATKTPVISTKVGMSNDLINHLKNGYFIEDNIERIDINDLISYIGNKDLLKKVKESAYNTVIKYDWKFIANSYQEKLYK